MQEIPSSTEDTDRLLNRYCKNVKVALIGNCIPEVSIADRVIMLAESKMEINGWMTKYEDNIFYDDDTTFIEMIRSWAKSTKLFLLISDLQEYFKENFFNLKIIKIITFLFHERLRFIIIISGGKHLTLQCKYTFNALKMDINCFGRYLNYSNNYPNHEEATTILDLKSFSTFIYNFLLSKIIPEVPLNIKNDFNNWIQNRLLIVKSSNWPESIPSNLSIKNILDTRIP